MINLRPQKRLGRKIKIRRKLVKSDAKGKTVALLPPKVMSFRSQPPRARKKSDTTPRVLGKTSLRSPAINIIRKATTPKIIPSQKTSCSLDNLYIGDC